LIIGVSGVAEARTDSLLQQDVDHIRDVGTVGVLAESAREADGDTLVTRARSGTSTLGGAEPVPWGSHVRIGSTTKTMVATVLLQLEAEGRLSLDDSVERWLPGVIRGTGNDGRRITVRHLLQQTSGLFDYVEDPEFLATILTPDGFYANRYNTYSAREIVAIALEHPPNFAPGARWQYSNTNYHVAGLVIEAVSGRAWEEELRDRIITPLGMTETTEPGTDPTLPTPFPRGYELFSDDGPYYDTTEHNMTWGGAAGSLISTPRDVATFFRALMSGRLLPPAQLAAMKSTVPMGRDYEAVWPGVRYGLGIMHSDLPCGGRYWHHGGDVIGYSNTNGVTPDGRRSAMVASSTNTLGDPEFAAGSLRFTNELVWNALCGYDTDPGSILASPGTRDRPAVLGAR
jgi:D-alanyl-D-alanine carboxypeptidase